MLMASLAGDSVQHLALRATHSGKVSTSENEFLLAAKDGNQDEFERLCK